MINALLSYAAYIGQMFYPAGMVVSIRSSGNAWWLQKPLPTGVCCAFRWRRLLWRRRCPYLAVGWFWYLGMLVPVIGLVQVGGQAMADRYTYLPQIGLYLMIAWGLRDLTACGGWPSTRPRPRRSSPCWPSSPGCRLRIGETA